MHTVNLEPFVYGGTNITGIRMVDPSESTVKDAVSYFNMKERNYKGKDGFVEFNETTLNVSTEITYYAILLYWSL